MFPKPTRKPKKRRSKTNEEKEWLNKVASLGCIICKSPANVHHIRHGMGMAQRNSHFNTIPLCFFHHQGSEGIHTLGTRKWEAKYGEETELLAKVKSKMDGCLAEKVKAQIVEIMEGKHE